jgi:hypothetical protein
VNDITSISVEDCNFSYGYTLTTLIGDYVYERPVIMSDKLDGFICDQIFYASRAFTRIYTSERKSEIFGRSFYDYNGSGGSPESKNGIGNQRITLIKGNKVVRYGITDRNGYYKFLNLEPGNDYRIRIQKGPEGKIIETTNHGLISLKNNGNIETENIVIKNNTKIELNFGFKLSLSEIQNYCFEFSDSSEDIPDLISGYLNIR